MSVETHQIHRCDRCGREQITKKDHKITLPDWCTVTATGREELERTFDATDLCPECSEKLFTWFMKHKEP